VLAVVVIVQRQQRFIRITKLTGLGWWRTIVKTDLRVRQGVSVVMGVIIAGLHAM
jgi:hypothetical protein